MSSSAITPTGPDTLTAAGNALDYFWGQCTRWVAEHFSWVGPNWGNAYQWLGSAQKAGYQTIGPTLAPPVGSIAVWGSQLAGSGGFGHVAEVVGQLPGGGFQVSEENYTGTGQTDTRTVTDTSALEGFILPPGGSRSAVLTSFDPSAVGAGVGAVGGPLGALMQGAGFAAGQAGGLVPDPGRIVGGALSGIGQGISGAVTAAVTDVGLFFQRQLVALVVAVVVAYILFS